jgi:hypothetical protein
MSTNMPGIATKVNYFYRILAILITGCVGVLGLVIWFYARELLMAMLIHFKVSAYKWRAIDNFSTVGFGLLWLVLVLVSPSIFLRGKSSILFWKNVSLVVGILLLLLFICHITPWFLGITMLSKVYLPLALIEGAACLVLIGIRFIPIRQ